MDPEIREVAEEVADRLRRRGVAVSDGDAPEDLADLLSAVERFELAVEARGGDLFVDDLNSSEPDDIHFVLPPRFPAEGIRSYVARIEDATARVRQHPDISLL